MNEDFIEETIEETEMTDLYLMDNLAARVQAANELMETMAALDKKEHKELYAIGLKILVRLAETLK